MPKTINVDGSTVKLDIWDTGGSEKYRSLAPMYYRDAQAAILVFDVTRPQSLEDAHEWLTELRDHGKSDCLVIGAANKVDLFDKRVVSKKEVEDFKFQNGIEKMYETSAKTGENIQEIFTETARLLIRQGISKEEYSNILDDLGPSSGTTQSNSSDCSC